MGPRRGISFVEIVGAKVCQPECARIQLPPHPPSPPNSPLHPDSPISSLPLLASSCHGPPYTTSWMPQAGSWAGPGPQRGGLIGDRRGGPSQPKCLREASFSHLTRITTEARHRDTRNGSKATSNQHELLPTKGGARSERSYRGSSGEGGSKPVLLDIDPLRPRPSYLEKMDLVQSNACCWCCSGERQSRHQLFVRSRACATRIREVWRRSGRPASGQRPRAPMQPSDCFYKMNVLPRRPWLYCGAQKSGG